jgi:hypothetical protein
VDSATSEIALSLKVIAPLVGFLAGWRPGHPSTTAHMFGRLIAA